MPSVCKLPFTYLEINGDGNCHFCCPDSVNNYCLGNIFEDDIDEIWNGEKAQAFRQDVLDEKYTFCNTNICFMQKKNKDYKLIADFPKRVHFAYDYFCSQSCVMCRDRIIIPDKKTIEFWNSKIDTAIIPLLKNAKIVSFNGAGEFFNNPHSKKLTEKIIEKYPHIKFAIISNGIYMNEENLKMYGILDKLDDIGISIHAITPKTYNKIVKNGNFKKVKENVEFLSTLKEKGMIYSLSLKFVVSSLNYKEMVKFAQWAKKINADIAYWPVRADVKTKFTDEIEKYSVFKEHHPEYNNFVRILQHPIFKEEFCYLPDYFKNLKPVSLLTKIKNKLKGKELNE